MRTVIITFGVLFMFFIVVLTEGAHLGFLLLLAIVSSIVVALLAAYDTYCSRKQEGGVR